MVYFSKHGNVKRLFPNHIDDKEKNLSYALLILISSLVSVLNLWDRRCIDHEQLYQESQSFCMASQLGLHLIPLNTHANMSTEPTMTMKQCIHRDTIRNKVL